MLLVCLGPEAGKARHVTQKKVKGGLPQGAGDALASWDTLDEQVAPVQVPVLKLHRLLGHRQRQHRLRTGSCRSGFCHSGAAKRWPSQECSLPQLIAL